MTRSALNLAAKRMRQRVDGPLVAAVILTLLGWLWTGASAQGQAPSEPVTPGTVYHLHGVVLDAITGEPVARALVQSVDKRFGTLTDSEGRFAADLIASVQPPAQQVPASSGPVRAYARYPLGLVLVAKKPGYFENRYGLKPVPLDGTLSSTDVVLKMMPYASISGHISIADAEPGHSAKIQLMIPQVEDGLLPWSASVLQATNSQGDFRFPELQPGEYTIVVTDGHDDRTSPRPMLNTVSRQYAPIYLGDVSERASAMRLHLRPGQQVHVEAHLRTVTYYPVTIPLAGRIQSGVQALVADWPDIEGNPLNYNDHDHVVEGALPSGSYDLILRNSDDSKFAKLSFHVNDAPLRLAPVTLSSGATIPVRLHMQWTGKNPQPEDQESVQQGSERKRPRIPQFELHVFTEDEMDGRTTAGREDAELMIENLPPGRYLVTATTLSGYIASITANGVDLMRTPLVIAPGFSPEAIDVQLRDDTATVSGAISDQGNDSAKTAALLFLPLDPPAHFLQTLVKVGDKFTVSNLAPGRYRVLALREYGVQVAYRDETIMRRLEGKGAIVTVDPGGSAVVDLTLLDPADVGAP